jgi:hypothetical protein
MVLGKKILALTNPLVGLAYFFNPRGLVIYIIGLAHWLDKVETKYNNLHIV